VIGVDRLRICFRQFDLDALCQERRPIPPLVGGSMLAGLIYTLAFSPWGAATQTGTERHPARRPTRETLMHWTAALSFGLTTAYTYEWLRRRSDAMRDVEERDSQTTPEWPPSRAAAR